VFENTLDYAQRFSRYKDKALIEEVRQYATLSLSLFKESSSHSDIFICIFFFLDISRLLRKYPLHSFEAVQIANLCPETAEEARTLIPSLQQQEDRALQALLDDISKLRKYT
jgi:DNA-directed RNA polymerase subunit F